MFAVAGSSSLRGFEVGRPLWFQGGILSLVRGKVRQSEEGEGGSGDKKGCEKGVRKRVRGPPGDIL